MSDLLKSLADSLDIEALNLKKRDFENPEMGKQYQWNLRANILEDFASALRKAKSN